MNAAEMQMNKGYLSAGQLGQIGYSAPTRTIGENIDARIASLQAEIDRLQTVRTQLASGSSLLDVRIEDLRQAMNY